jgi:hypothetical protein
LLDFNTSRTYLKLSLQPHRQTGYQKEDLVCRCSQCLVGLAQQVPSVLLDALAHLLVAASAVAT